jgi:hypothetical protein
VKSSDGADQDSGLVYAEDRCALRWPLVCIGLLGSAGGAALAVVCFWLAVITSYTRWFAVLSTIGMVVSCVWTQKLWSNWPTGIRVDTAGIRIGGVRRKPHFTVPAHSVLGQRHEVFTCPWAAVRGVAVTDRAGLRGLQAQLAAPQPAAHARRRPSRIAHGLGYHNVTGWPPDTEMMRPRTSSVRLGWMPAPFMRASLVIYVEPDKAYFPPLRPWRWRGHWTVPGSITWQMQKTGTHSGIWLAPTRHPDALRATLARVPGCPPVMQWAALDDEGSPARPT